MKKLALLLVLISPSVFSQGRGDPNWHTAGPPQASAPGSCSGTGNVYLITDGTYRICIAGIVENPFTSISGVTGSGAANTFSLWTGSSAIGNSNLIQNGSTGQLSASKSFAGPAPAPMSFSATPTFDLSTCNRCEMAAMTANVTSVTFTHPQAGQHFSLTFLQDGTGGRAVTGYTVAGGSVTHICVVSPTLNVRTTQEFEVASDGVTIRGLSCTSDDGAARDVQPSTAGPGQFATGVNSTGALTYAAGSGGVASYYAAAPTLSGTQYAPIFGNAAPNSTEATVSAPSPTAATIGAMYVKLSAAPGGGNSVAVTFRDAGSSTSLTCTVSGASATTCDDVTHTATAAQGDLVDYQVVTTGSVGTPNVTITVQYGAVPSGLAGGNVTNSNASGSYPGTCTNGDLEFPTNSFYVFRCASNVWVPWGPVFPMVDPTTPSWSWVNQNAASMSTSNGGIFLQCESNSGVDINARVITAPSTPYFITVALLPQLSPTGSAHTPTASLVFRDSGTGKMVVFYLSSNTGYNSLNVAKYASATSFSASYSLTSQYDFPPSSLAWMQVKDDGTNFKFYGSADGQNFYQVFSISRTDYLASPNQVGFACDANQSSLAPAVTLLSWYQH